MSLCCRAADFLKCYVIPSAVVKSHLRPCSQVERQAPEPAYAVGNYLAAKCFSRPIEGWTRYCRP